MKLEIILKNIEILESKIGRSRISPFLKKKYPLIFKFILNSTKFLDKFDERISIFERIFCLKHNLLDRPLCKKCHKNHVNGFNLVKNEYRKWCSPSCQASDPECIAKTKNTCLRKYGAENYNGLEKARETRKKKYGGWSDIHFGEKLKKTKKERYGSENWNNSKKQKETIQKRVQENSNYWKEREDKTKQTKISKGLAPNWNNREKFKKTISQFSDDRKKEIAEKREEKNIERYGYAYPLQCPDIKKKTKETILRKYGVTSTFNTTQAVEKMILRKREDAWERFILDKEYTPMFSKEEYLSNKDHDRRWLWKCNKCQNTFESRYSDGHHTVCRVCNPIKYSFDSSQEKLLFQKILELDPLALRGDRKLIFPNEIDIFSPKQKLGFEYNGIYWHSSLLKDRRYHLEKTEKCEKKGIRLIQIFENEWLFKKDIVWSRILNLFGIFSKKIYGRKCIVKEVDFRTSTQFQEMTHIQGAISAKVNLGLFFEDKLVALMTFGKPRFNKNYEWELLRFSTELGYHIPGGASKLLKYFERNYKPKSLISYADRRWSQGKLYRALGFSFIHNTQPNYWYVDPNDELLRFKHRSVFQKHKLKDLLENFDPKLSEVQNMHNNGYLRIFDCGNMVFEKTYA